jgi:hypothetical protein
MAFEYWGLVCRNPYPSTPRPIGPEHVSPGRCEGLGIGRSQHLDLVTAKRLWVKRGK